jgi:hypothetical protein
MPPIGCEIIIGLDGACPCPGIPMPIGGPIPGPPGPENKPAKPAAIPTGGPPCMPIILPASDPCKVICALPPIIIGIGTPMGPIGIIDLVVVCTALLALSMI